MVKKEASEAKSSTSAEADSAAARKTTKKTAKPKTTKKETKDGVDKKGTDAKAEASIKTKEVEPGSDAKASTTAVKTAKAGKRSEKALKEAEEKQKKEERKLTASESKAEGDKLKVAQKQSRTRLERRSKGYRSSSEKIDKSRAYKVTEAIELATKTSHVKFDATVELHLNLAVDPKQADQNVRDTVVMPAGTGKSVRIAVFADPEGVSAAKKAGADLAGSEEFLQDLDKEKLDFDVLISTPALMAKLGKYARLLGPKGLMPNPKSGTVTNDIAKAVKEAKSGRVEYRVDSTGIIHISIGKVSFPSDKLLENAKAVFSSVKSNKPASLKGAYMSSAFVATSMGPSIQLDVSDISSL